LTTKNIVDEARQVQLCIDLIELGARLQVLEVETNLSRGRLLKLYKEVKGESPPKGMLPFSADWFITWMPNIHSSLFYNIYRKMKRIGGIEPMTAFIKSYRLYLEQLSIDNIEPALSLTRAWTLVRFFDNGILELSACGRCGGDFVVHALDPKNDYLCGICQPPSRAGKTVKS